VFQKKLNIRCREKSLLRDEVRLGETCSPGICGREHLLPCSEKGLGCKGRRNQEFRSWKVGEKVSASEDASNAHDRGKARFRPSLCCEDQVKKKKKKFQRKKPSSGMIRKKKGRKKRFSRVGKKKYCSGKRDRGQ